jgi:hypothetical protein
MDVETLKEAMKSEKLLNNYTNSVKDASSIWEINKKILHDLVVSDNENSVIKDAKNMSKNLETLLSDLLKYHNSLLNMTFNLEFEEEPKEKI